MPAEAHYMLCMQVWAKADTFSQAPPVRYQHEAPNPACKNAEATGNLLQHQGSLGSNPSIYTCPMPTFGDGFIQLAVAHECEAGLVGVPICDISQILDQLQAQAGTVSV
jgi:hypothetical protein